MQPEISIIMPIYNVEDYLQQSLYSVTKQSLKNIEILCVDDGSTDSSPAILRYFAGKDKRIKVITTANYGYGHAMNTGIEEAKGIYIGIVEPDDYVLPDMFEYLLDAARMSGADIVKSDFYRFTEENGVQDRFFQPAVTDKRFYRRLLDPKENKECFRFMMNIWCGIYRKELIDRYHIRFHESKGASFQDNGFWFQTMCYAGSVFYLDQAFYMNRRDNPSSSVNRKDNVYACNNEYKYIREFLSARPRLQEQFLDVYAMKKYETYLFNLNRIPAGQREEYLESLSAEWKRDLADGDLREEFFRPEEWQNIMRIINRGNYLSKYCKNTQRLRRKRKWQRRKRTQKYR